MCDSLKTVRIRPAAPKSANEHRSLKTVRVIGAAKK
jgi:hypothetical protein